MEAGVVAGDAVVVAVARTPSARRAAPPRSARSVARARSSSAESMPDSTRSATPTRRGRVRRTRRRSCRPCRPSRSSARLVVSHRAGLASPLRGGHCRRCARLVAIARSTAIQHITLECTWWRGAIRTSQMPLVGFVPAPAHGTDHQLGHGEMAAFERDAALAQFVRSDRASGRTHRAALGATPHCRLAPVGCRHSRAAGPGLLRCRARNR